MIQPHSHSSSNHVLLLFGSLQSKCEEEKRYSSPSDSHNTQVMIILQQLPITMPQETENKPFIFNTAVTSHGLSSVCVHAVLLQSDFTHLLTPRQSHPVFSFFCQKSIYTKLAEQFFCIRCCVLYFSPAGKPCRLLTKHPEPELFI